MLTTASNEESAKGMDFLSPRMKANRDAFRCPVAQIHRLLGKIKPRHRAVVEDIDDRGGATTTSGANLQHVRPAPGERSPLACWVQLDTQVIRLVGNLQLQYGWAQAERIRSS